MIDVATEIDDARRHTRELLGHLGVTRIVVVDDEANPRDASLIRQVERPHKIGSEEWDREGSYADWLDGVWPRATTIEQRRAHLQAARAANPTLLANPLDVLCAISKGTQFQLITPDEWIDAPAAALGTAGVQRSLVLFDRALGGDLGPTGGDRLLGEYLRENPDGTAGILTSTIDVSGELDDLEDIATSAAIEADSLLLASKDQLTVSSCGTFVDFLRFSGNARSIKVIRGRVADAINSAHGSAMEELRRIPLRVLEDMVVRSSRTEGAWEVDTLLRVFEILEKRDLHDRVLGARDPGLGDAIARARELSNVVHPDHEPSRARARTLTVLERYTPATVINAAGLQVDNGDIFLIAAAPFLLLVQPCDIALRDRAGPREQRPGRLVPVVEFHREAEHLAGAPRQWELPAGFPDDAVERPALSLPAAKYVSMDILDLCAFDPEGRARLDTRRSQPPIHPVTPGLGRRYEELRADAMSRAKSRRTARHSRRPRASRARMGEVELSARWRADFKVISYDVRRVGRLTAGYAAGALANYAADVSRAAYEHDLERFSAQPGRA